MSSISLNTDERTFSCANELTGSDLSGSYYGKIS